MKKYIVINYRYGIFKNIELEEFINLMLIENPEYELFQVIEYFIFQLGGGNSVRKLILKLK